MDNQESNENGPDKAEMGLLGEYLKQRRVEKNFTLEKLSQKTKISINILKNLEANDYRHLPSAAYIKGFVRSYVKILGIPQDEAINKMEYTYLSVLGKPFPILDHTKVMSSTKSQPAPYPKKSNESEPTPNEVIEGGDSIIENTKSVFPVIILGVVILLFVGGYKLISTIVESEVGGHKVKDHGPKIESSAALVNTPQNVEAPASATTAGVSDASQAVNTNSEKNEEKVVEVKKVPELQRNFPTVEFKKVRGKLFSMVEGAPENDDETLIPKQIKDAMNSSNQNIYIKAIDGNTWLSYKIDNFPIESVIINKGNDLFLQGGEIRVFLGNVNVTKIFYNNKLISTPTKSGVKSLIFPEESNAKFQLPLFPKAKDDILYTADDYIKRMKLEEDEVAKRKQAE